MERDWFTFAVIIIIVLFVGMTIKELAEAPLIDEEDVRKAYSKVDILEVTYRNEDLGRDVDAVLYLPKDYEPGGKLPGVVFGRGAGDPRAQVDKWEAFSVRYSRLGNAFIIPLHPQRNYKNTWTDYKYAAKYLEDNYGVENIGCAGTSLGNMEIMMFVQEDDICDAYVNIGGALPVQQHDYYLVTNRQIEKMDGVPSLFIVGENEGVFLSYQLLIMAKMQEVVSSTPYYQEIYEGMDHGFMSLYNINNPTRERYDAAANAQGKMITFFNWVLKDEAMPAWYVWNEPDDVIDQE
tara:strand:- start:8161 stop:9039 length:879 start_codon:yes stop_codon:yes gene_type:complete